MRLFYLLFTLYGLSHIYVFVCLRRAFGGGKWQIPVLIWLTAMAVSWLWRFGRMPGPVGEKFQDISFCWMGFLVFLCYCLIAADLLALLSRLLAFATKGAWLREAAGHLVAPRYVPLAIALALVLFVYSLYEARNPRVLRLDIATAKLAPGARPLRVAAVADLHLSSLIGPRMLERMAGKIQALEPDVLLISGDLVDTDMRLRHEDAAILRSIRAPMGKFAVSGNHESYHGLQMSLDFMKRSGLTVLRGQAVEVGGITIAGVDDGSFAGRFEPDSTDVLRVLSLIPEGRFVLLVNHKPYYPEAALGRFDLQFSGHTHAGQFWPGELITKKIYRVEQGLNTLFGAKGSSLLFVTNGLGFWGPPIRFLAPPEIVLFTIRPEEPHP
ncbi:metallophosphoesterase [Desulfovibrio sp. OttesenSCG-928-A18]|nr:metallophosphoesterase [Desulfovibrio sp. OttesenSCG-928-A18]